MKTYRPKVCPDCGCTFTPTGPAHKRCNVCGAKQAKIVRDRATYRSQVKKGVRVGIGSGNGQPRGKDHPTYKNGIKRFIDFSATARRTIQYCERCGKDLLNAGQGNWATHHKDHNRNNNPEDGSNFELLCKRCHQIEHRCWEAFNKRKPPMTQRELHEENAA